MKLSDLIRALEGLKEKHGDLPVMEARQVWYDGACEYFKGVDLNDRVRTVAAYQYNNKHHWNNASDVPADWQDRREFLAFIVCDGVQPERK